MVIRKSKRKCPVCGQEMTKKKKALICPDCGTQLIGDTIIRQKLPMDFWSRVWR